MVNIEINIILWVSTKVYFLWVEHREIGSIYNKINEMLTFLLR